MVGAATLLHGQGYIEFYGSSANIETNTASFYNQVAYGSGTAGKTAAYSLGGQIFDYALLFLSSNPGGSANPTNQSWSSVSTYVGSNLIIGTNSVAPGGLYGLNTSSGVQVNMAATTQYWVMLVGWSANLGTLAQVLTQYGNASWNANGYFNFETVGTMTPNSAAGSGDPTIFPGTWANSTFSLFAVAPAGTPEPSTLALAALGGASLLMFRRRKV